MPQQITISESPLTLDALWQHWIRKTAHALALSPSMPCGTTALVERFLTANPGDPRAIPPSQVVSFIDKGLENFRDALTFFYDQVAHSPDHLEVLKQMQSKQAAPNLLLFSPTQAAIPTLKEIGTYLNAHTKMLHLHEYCSRTQINYVQAVEQFLIFCHNQKLILNAPSVNTYLKFLKNQHEWAARTINLNVSALRFFFEQVLSIELSNETVPCEKARRPLPRIHTLYEVRKIIESARMKKHRIILMLAYGCGLRVDEIRKLTPHSIDLGRKNIQIGEGDKARLVMLDKSICIEIERFMSTLRKPRYLFENERISKPITARAIASMYDSACLKANISSQGGIHTLRHSFAVHLIQQGIDLRHVQELLGHKNSRTTEMYSCYCTKEPQTIKSPIAQLKLVTSQT